MLKKYDLLTFTDETKALVCAATIYKDKEYVLTDEVLSDESDVLGNFQIYEVVSENEFQLVNNDYICGQLMKVFLRII